MNMKCGKIETCMELKTLPIQLFELPKDQLIKGFNEALKGKLIVEVDSSDGGKTGTVLTFKSSCGTNMNNKIRVENIDYKNKKIRARVIEGDLLTGLYLNVTICFEILGLKICVIVEYESGKNQAVLVPEPTKFLDDCCSLIKEMDLHFSK